MVTDGNKAVAMITEMVTGCHSSLFYFIIYLWKYIMVSTR